MTRGVVMTAMNNERVDYGKLATISARLVQLNLGCPVTLITDSYTRDNLPDRTLFDHVIIQEDEAPENRRCYRDTRYYQVTTNFRNSGRASAYDLSPYDETILLDADYLTFSPSLNVVWGNVEDLLISRKAIRLNHEQLSMEEQRLSPEGIDMYWATVIYFRKSEVAHQVFDAVSFIRENWEFYSTLLQLKSDMFRNDFAFSLALHLIGGRTGVEWPRLPMPIMTALDFDQLYKVVSPVSATFFVNDLTETWKFSATTIKGVDVHCMNKFSILNNYDAIMETLA
jgi:hypothetical protein